MLDPTTDILRPSSADIWSYCAAQPALVKQFAPDDEPSDEAMEGTCAAWLAEMVLTGQAEDCRSMVGQLCPENNWPVDHAMANHIQGYVDMVTGRGGEMKAERRVHLNEFINGTPDAYAVVTESHHPDYDPGTITAATLHVDDLKYGFGIVSPYSRQVVVYAGAIYNEVMNRHYDDVKITIGIYQPRAMHHDGIYRTRTITPQQLMSEIEHIITMGRKCYEPDPMATPGRHCKHCPVAHVCPAATTEMYDIVTMIRSSTARDLTPTELAKQLEFISMAEDVLKGMKRAIETDATARMENGVTIPGWGRKRGVGRRRYTQTDPRVIQIMTGVDPSADSLCTPAELERRGASKAILKLITETPPTKAKLVPVTVEDVAKKFGE